MKKARSILLIAVLLACMAAVGMGESLFVDNRETDKIYPERLNLRAEASKNGAIIGLFYTGAEVEALEYTNEEYVKVQIGGVTGYMAGEYLITREEATARYGTDGDFGDCRAAEIDLSGLWKSNQPLFTQTDPASASVATLAHGEQVGLVGILDDWAYVYTEASGERVYGYVPLDTLTDVGELKVMIVAGKKADTQTKLYDAPNDRANEIMTLKNGTACFALFGRKEGEWRRVRVGGVSGWIRYTQADNLFALGAQPRNVVPYYPLLMQTKRDALLLSAKDDQNQVFMTLGQDMKVEVLAESGDYAYVRTLEGGAGAYDCGDYGYMRISDLSLTATGSSVGVVQMDNGDVPVLLLDQPQADAQMIGALCSGAQVRIAAYTQTDYMQVTLGDVMGYVLKNEIRIMGGDNAQPSDRIPQRATAVKTLTLMSEPGAASEGTQSVAQGERVYMLGVLGNWAYVQAGDKAGLEEDALNDRTGFVPLSSLSAPASTTHLTAKVNKDKINLRSEGGREGEIIGRARLDERLRVAEYGTDWCCVVTPTDKRGYIMTEYLEFEQGE